MGGDLAFPACIQGSGQSLTNRNIAVGDPEGNPIPQTSWYVFKTGRVPMEFLGLGGTPQLKLRGLVLDHEVLKRAG